MTKVITLDFDGAPVYESEDLRRYVLRTLRAFIGMNAEEIKSAWIALGIPDSVIDAGQWTDTKEAFICVSLSSVGAPLLECTFDKSGKCFSQTLSIHAEDASLCMGRIRELGFSFSSRNKPWTKPETNYTWRIEESAKDRVSVTVRRFKTIQQ